MSKVYDRPLVHFCRISIFSVHGAWGEWEEWEDCTVSCGGGSQLRARKCDRPKPEFGGKDCSHDGSTSRDAQICNDFSCPGTGYTERHP